MDNKRTAPREAAERLSGDAFSAHALLVLSGHRKRATRLVHLCTSHGMVSTLLFLAHTLTAAPLPALLTLLWLYYAAFSRGRLVLATWSVACTACAASLYFARVAAAQRPLATNLCAFLAFGLPEHFSHALFGDGDRNLVTRHCRSGLDKVRGILFLVVLPSPLCFWHLLASDIRLGGVGAPAMAELQARASTLLRQVDEVTLSEQNE